MNIRTGRRNWTINILLANEKLLKTFQFMYNRFCKFIHHEHKLHSIITYNYTAHWLLFWFRQALREKQICSSKTLSVFFILMHCVLWRVVGFSLHEMKAHNVPILACSKATGAMPKSTATTYLAPKTRGHSLILELIQQQYSVKLMSLSSSHLSKIWGG